MQIPVIATIFLCSNYSLLPTYIIIIIIPAIGSWTSRLSFDCENFFCQF